MGWLDRFSTPPNVPSVLLTPPYTQLSDVSVLHVSRAQPLKRAIKRLLDTAVAESTYAQIIDGLPTRESLRDFQLGNIPDHPVVKLSHDKTCQVALDKAREFRANFEVSSLQFPLNLLIAYQDTTPHTHPYPALDQNGKQFQLRLVELVAVACHQIAVYLYQLEAGPHKHSVYEEWSKKPPGQYEPARLPAAFCHNRYFAVDQYQSAVADCAGYWAEAKIFGGVVVFDRGRQETNTFFLDPSARRGGTTIYAPTLDQFIDFLTFLLHPDDTLARDKSPLPMRATFFNRYRWDPWDAMALYNIYRDPHERVLPLDRPQRGCTRSSSDYPEDDDMTAQVLDMYKPGEGVEVDEREAKRRAERMKQITPSSRLWPRAREYKGIILGKHHDGDDGEYPDGREGGVIDEE